MNLDNQEPAPIQNSLSSPAVNTMHSNLSNSASPNTHSSATTTGSLFNLIGLFKLQHSLSQQPFTLNPHLLQHQRILPQLHHLRQHNQLW